MSMRLPGEELVSGKEVNVETSQGELLGATSTTADGTHYFTFRGVPYAKPPVGPLRFKSPQEAEPWKGQRDARKFATRCLQEDGGSEDCLYLNIFTPQLGPNSNLPVMVWFHWGAFAFGSADLDPGHIMDLGVVVVSVQYRLNVFGKGGNHHLLPLHCLLMDLSTPAASHIYCHVLWKPVKLLDMLGTPDVYGVIVH
uniref:Carboxylesterase type B domain-containing protein n=1 Tax=Timema tahoe TaxID=61484 RepID=A0A7R9ILY0_9NEOP|nr:unnamed protein product [Timema tahoe]